MKQKTIRSTLYQRMLSLGIMLCLLSGTFSGVLPGPAAAVDAIQVSLPANFVEIGQSSRLVVTDAHGDELSGAEISFVSADDNIVRVEPESGVVTGISIGLTDVQVQVDVSGMQLQQSITIPVVGENLLIRNGVNHGDFEANIWLNGKDEINGAAARENTAWYNYGYQSGKYNVNQNYSMLSERISHLTGKPTNIPKFTFGDDTSETTRRDLRLQTFENEYLGEAADHRGDVMMDKDKLYEFTGWLKAENTEFLDENLNARIMLYQTTPTNSTYYALNNNMFMEKPWLGCSGDQDWTFFRLPVPQLSGLAESIQRDTIGANLRIMSTSGMKKGDILACHFSFHEVGYAQMEFSAMADTQDMIPNSTVQTQVKHYTNTGTEITGAFLTTSSSKQYPIPVMYTSDKPSVATVSKEGVITAVGGGTATVTAQATLGGVTLTREIPVTVQGATAPSNILLDFSELTTKQNEDQKWVVDQYNHANFTIDEAKSNLTSHRMNGTNAPMPFDALHIAMGGPKSSWLADEAAAASKNYRFTIHFDVPAAGLYTVDFTGAKWFAGCAADVFIDDQYAGDYDFCNGGPSSAPRTMGDTKKLRTLSLVAGSHELSMRTRGGSLHDTAYFLPYQIMLTPVEEAPTLQSVTGTIGKSTLNLGDAETIVGCAQMSDGSSYCFGYTDDGRVESGESFSIASGQPNVAEVSAAVGREAGKANRFTAQVSAKDVGSSNITLTATVGDQTKSTVIPVTVAVGNVLESIELAIAQPSLMIGNTTQASANGRMVSGEPADLNGAEIAYRSADPRIAEINADTGVITAVGTGEVDITATVTLAGVTKTDTKTLTVHDSSLAALFFEKGSMKLLLTDSITLEPKGVLSDGTHTDLRGYPLRYQSSAPEILAVDDAGTLTPLALGSAVVTVSAPKSGGRLVSASIEIIVIESPEGFQIRFNAVDTALTDGKHAIVDYHDAGFTVAPEKSNNRVHRIFIPSGSTGNVRTLNVYLGGKDNSWLGANADNMNCRFTVHIQVPYSGRYNVFMLGATWFSGCIADVFIDDRFVGDYTFTDGDTSFKSLRAPGENKQLSSVYLSVGTHEVSFRTRGNCVYPDAYLLLQEMRFTPAGGTLELAEVEASIPEKMMLGESLEIPLIARRQDGSAVHFGVTDSGAEDTQNTLTCENMNEDVLQMSAFSPSVLGKSGAGRVRLSAASIGTSTVTVTAKVDGAVESVRFPVEVTDEKLSKTSVRAEREQVHVGDSVKLIPMHTLDSGRQTSSPAITVRYVSLTPWIASVDGERVTALQAGTARIQVTASFGAVTVEGVGAFEVSPEYPVALQLSAGGSDYIKINGERTPLFVTLVGNLGSSLDMPQDAEVSYEALTPEIASLDADGYITAHALGQAHFRATVTAGGKVLTKEVAMRTLEGKTEPTMMSFEKRENVRKNAARYAWARDEVETVVKRADNYLHMDDWLWSIVPSEGIPRSMIVGIEGDPNMYTCRYCGVALGAKYGSKAYIVNPEKNPWKVQCADCRRFFPSNDFESFYQLGLNDYGEFSVDLARARNAELVAGGEKGYLKNILYPETAEKFGDADWGVDDGFGYVSGKELTNGPERYTYIAYYNHFLWFTTGTAPGYITQALQDLSTAYAYTGEAKYGRTGAILLDRIADVYPDYDLYPYRKITWNSQGGTYRGRILGNIWESHIAAALAKDYDMLFPIFDDPYVVNYLKNKSQQVKMRHSKENGTQIRNNIEDGLLREIYRGVQDATISGNFGIPQRTIAVAALALDSMPETGEWLDWMMAAGKRDAVPCTGGNVGIQIVDNVDRDGQGNEASAYNVIWINNLITIADILDGYQKYPVADLYQNPKIRNMIESNTLVMASNYYSPQIGDSSSTAAGSIWMTADLALRGFKQYGEAKYAQFLYKCSNNSVESIRDDITTAEPEKIKQQVSAVIKEQGEINTSSHMMSGFGYAVIKDGAYYDSVNREEVTNSQRNLWMYFGKNTGHGHRDTLNLGMDAFGLNMAPDLGYPEATGTQPNRLQWVANTLSHNTVVVDQEKQGDMSSTGEPLHFDDSGPVKLIDVEAKAVYPQTDSYRRTVVMVQVDDQVSYGVDFFRIVGGDDHLYSFHALSDEISDTAGLELVRQADENGSYIGSYAGPDVPYGPDPDTNYSAWEYPTRYPRGFTWLDQVSRAAHPQDTFAVDFAVKDFRKNAGKVADDLHLRLTMLNNEKNQINEAAIANGYPPDTSANKSIPHLKYLLVRRSGKDLDTLFTTVLEPYSGKRYLQSMENVPVALAEGGQPLHSNDVRAIKVTHVNGRVDYIVYARNNTVTYQIDGRFNFRGFLGVCSYADGEPVYTYLNDGDILDGQVQTRPSLTGTVLDFTKELAMKNQIRVTADPDVAPEAFVGRYIQIDNDGVENGSYKVQGAYRDTEGHMVLDMGTTSPVRRYRSSADLSQGFVYNIAEGQSYRVPLAYLRDDAPVLQAVQDRVFTAGRKNTVSVSGESPLGRQLTYCANTLPRGASFDPDTQTLSWTPDNNQLGKHHVAVDASDGLRSATVHFYITVAASSGSGVPSVSPADDTTPDKDEKPGPDKEGEQGSENTNDNQKQFVDLTGYDWAQSAIQRLSELGVIKGTSPDHFSPGRNVTRADFACLLVRAFRLNSDAQESFADVEPGAYYAKELAIAKASGIVQGVGDNQFLPRAEISRQDLALMLYRALNKVGYMLQEGDASLLASFQDSAQISDYALAAVAALVTNQIMAGDNTGKIQPQSKATRAEAAVLLDRVLGKHTGS